MVSTRMDDMEDSISARLDWLEMMIADMAEAMRQQQEQQQQQPPAPPTPIAPPVVQDHQVEDWTIALTKEFKKMKLSSFKGGI